jgi:hypothetical protein
MRIPISRSFEVFDTNDCCLMDGTIKRYNQVPVSRGMYGTVLSSSVLSVHTEIEDVTSRYRRV